MSLAIQWNCVCVHVMCFEIAFAGRLSSWSWLLNVESSISKVWWLPLLINLAKEVGCLEAYNHLWLDNLTSIVCAVHDMPVIPKVILPSLLVYNLQLELSNATLERVILSFCNMAPGLLRCHVLCLLWLPFWYWAMLVVSGHELNCCCPCQVTAPYSDLIANQDTTKQ